MQLTERIPATKSRYFSSNAGSSSSPMGLCALPRLAPINDNGQGGENHPQGRSIHCCSIPMSEGGLDDRMPRALLVPPKFHRHLDSCHESTIRVNLDSHLQGKL